MPTILKNFVVIEGLDGSGTTTQLKALDKILTDEGKKTFITCEPTTGPIGCLIRQFLSGQIKTTPGALARLYSADREDHLFHENDGIIARLKEGYTVLSDRYLFSSLAYQSIGIGYAQVALLNRFPLPEKLIFIDTPVAVCMQRIEKRGNCKEIFEKQAFLEKVEANYRKILSELDSGICLIKIDGTLGPDAITAEILQQWHRAVPLST
ncbi:MAG: dTMP kinase [Spirochaetia bacterium]|jgi:dTMP kinase|nr:dTMP kinase [Spirochaetia bacterium]